MRSSAIPIVVVVAALLGGAAALGIGAGTGLLGDDTKTVVVNARGLAQPASLPAAARSSVAPLTGNGFDPAKIYAGRSRGVVTIYAFFGDPGSDNSQEAQGSGFVISPKGYILTNSHVITNAGEGGPVHPADKLYIEFSDLDRVEAKVVGWDVFDDVGLLRVDPKGHRLLPVPLGSSASVVVGEPVAAIGSPLNNDSSLSVGVVSAVRRSIEALTVRRFNIVDAIQTDAAITHGNSGGPLFDARGRVIGINAQIRSQSSGGNDSGVAFAVPIDSAKRSVAQLIAHGDVAYAYVGIETVGVTPAIAKALSLGADHGALVAKVVSGGPAARAGLHPGSKDVTVLGEALRRGGDLILAIDGQPVRDSTDVVRIVSNRLRPGQVAAFTVSRDGKRRTVAVKLGSRPTG